MKKIKLGIILLALSLSMVLVSCGGTPEEKVANYIEKSLTTESMKQAEATSEAAGMELKVVAEGTSVVYQYTFVADVEELGGAEALTQQLQELSNDQALIQTLESGLDLIQTECSDVTSLKNQYYDNQGNLLASTEVN